MIKLKYWLLVFIIFGAIFTGPKYSVFNLLSISIYGLFSYLGLQWLCNNQRRVRALYRLIRRGIKRGKRFVFILGITMSLLSTSGKSIEPGVNNFVVLRQTNQPKKSVDSKVELNNLANLNQEQYLSLLLILCLIQSGKVHR